jgi:hypothetical protein
MAGLAHLGVGLAAKRAAPRVPLGILVLCAYAIDLLFMVFWLLRLERLPKGAKARARAAAEGRKTAAVDLAGGPDQAGGPAPTDDPDPPAPWSHGLFMAVVWSALAGLIAHLLRRRPRLSLFIALLVFSHWIVDFITQPMRASFPGQLGLLLLFRDSRKVGLGLYSSSRVANVCEYGSVVVGALVYGLTLVKLRRERAAGLASP